MLDAGAYLQVKAGAHQTNSFAFNEVDCCLDRGHAGQRGAVLQLEAGMCPRR